MGGLKNYLIAVCSAAILCAILQRIVGKGKIGNGTVRLLSGLFVAICIIAPWKDFSFEDLDMYNPFTSQQAGIYADTGKQMTQKQIQAIIIEKTEAYVLEKANQMRVQVEVRVELSEESIPLKTVISGELSPEDKEELSVFLLRDLGIQKEMQVWR